MVLCLKTWESRSSPGLPRTENFLFINAVVIVPTTPSL
jgi:hypothetical protein